VQFISVKTRVEKFTRGQGVDCTVQTTIDM